jgi:hypothetical protein
VAISSKLVKVITAYFMELALGLLLGLGTIILEQRDSKRGFPCAVNRAFGVYADAATLLTFSVQFASAIILIKMDFGISAKDFGGLTVEVTWAAALVTMVSMLLVCSSGADLDRKEVRLSVICISWILFLYTFISRMISDFGPSQIGISKPGSPPKVLSPVEAANITQLCRTDGSTLSKTETIAFDVFAVGGSLFVSIVLVGTLIWVLLTRRRPDAVRRLTHSRSFRVNVRNRISVKNARLLLLFNVLLWGVPQLWGILRFRAMQQALAVSTGASDQDNSWSFGQIVAVVIFLPVLLEFVYVYLKGPPETESKANGQGHSGRSPSPGETKS